MNITSAAKSQPWTARNYFFVVTKQRAGAVVLLVAAGGAPQQTSGVLEGKTECQVMSSWSRDDISK